MRLPTALLISAVLCLKVPAVSGIELPTMFGRHAVLQREEAVPVWGWGKAGEEVNVTFAGQSKRTTADDKGNWRVELDALKASASGQVLEVTGTESGRLRVPDLLVGEEIGRASCRERV